MLWRVWEDVRRGAAHFHPGSVSLPVKRLEQFVHGLCMPFHVLRALWAERDTRRRYLTVSLVQVAVIVALTGVFTSMGEEVVETVGPEEWSEVHEEELQAQREVALDEEEAQADLEDAAAGLKDAAAEQEGDRQQRAKLEKAAEGMAVLAERLGADGAEVRAKMKEAAKQVEEKAAKKAEEKAGEKRRAEQKAGGSGERKVHWVVHWTALLSALHLAQWIVIALSRDYHTELMREASVLTGIPPEDEPLSPRVRLNTQWLRRKLKQRSRGMMMFTAGLPVFWLLARLMVWGAGGLLNVWGSRGIYLALLSVWGAWWFVVFSAGKTSLAWGEKEPRAPWFLRGWNWLTARAGPVGPAMRTYGSLWTRFTREVFSPAACVERQPWSVGGLAVARAVASIPLVKCFARPLFPVAAAHLLTAGAASVGEGSAGPGGTEPVRSARAAS